MHVFANISEPQIIAPKPSSKAYKNIKSIIAAEKMCSLRDQKTTHTTLLFIETDSQTGVYLLKHH
jgi:hypothetical protein